MDSVSTSVRHGIVFILDPRNKEVQIPEYVKNELVASAGNATGTATAVVFSEGLTWSTIELPI